MIGKTNLQTDAATFGASKSLAGLEALAMIQARRERRANLITAVIATAVFMAAFSAAFVIGA